MALPPSVALRGLVVLFALPPVGVSRRRRSSDDPDWATLRRWLVLNWVVFLAPVLAAVAVDDHRSRQ